jgi:aminoglycoside phosphotransferase (APT) family kinase protein
MSAAPSTGRDIVPTWAAADTGDVEPLIVIETLTAFLDSVGLGSGPLDARSIGAGHSNVTYLLRRGSDRFVLRRPPRGPLPRSTHDVLREARLQQLLAGERVRVPTVLAICERPEVIGGPFYLMDFLDGHVLDRALPAQLSEPDTPASITEELLDALVELHAVDVANLSELGRPTGYLDRQLLRFAQLLDASATRPLPDLVAVGDWLAINRPARSETTVVHGDYRLGNVMIGPQMPPRVVALLDWEMATLGDPLADIGYLTATWAEPDDLDDPMLELSAVTRLPGFPARSELADSYAQRTGRDLRALRWYQALALWKASIFLEGSYARHLAGTTSDPYFAGLEIGVPALARRALRLTR